jgi:hypothetical protein
VKIGSTVNELLFGLILNENFPVVPLELNFQHCSCFRKSPPVELDHRYTVCENRLNGILAIVGDNFI